MRVFQKVFLFTQCKLKPFLKRPILIIFLFIVSSGCLLLTGIGFIEFLKTPIPELFPTQTQSSLIKISITAQTLQGYFKRDIFITLVLAGFLSYLSISGFQKIIGAQNPFFNRSSDGYFFQKIPVDSMFAYSSARFQSLVVKLIFTVVACSCVFVPILLYFNIPLWHLPLIIINFLIGFEFVTIFGDMLYFIFQPLREGHSWAEKSLDKSNPLLIIVDFGVPAVFLQLASEGVLFTFNTMSNFILLPFVNECVVITGFLLRSDPTESCWWALFIVIVEYIIFNAFILSLIQLSSPTRESADQLPSIGILEGQQKIKYSNMESIVLQPSNVDKIGNIEFIGKGSVNALLLRDFIAFVRINSYIMAPFLLFLLEIVVVYYQLSQYSTAHGPILTSLAEIYPFLLLTTIFLLVDLLNKFYDLNQNRMNPVIPIYRVTVYKEQVVGTIFILLIFSLPFILANIMTAPLALLLMGGTTFLFTKLHLNSLYYKMITSFFIGIIVLAILFL